MNINKQYDNDNIVISGVGIHHPEESISNAELVNVFNVYAEKYNIEHQEEIFSGYLKPLKKQTANSIERVSGIKNRYVRDKENVLNPNIMWPYIPERENNILSLQAEVCVIAAKQAIKSAYKNASEINAIIMSCSHKQRDYPGIAIEVQHALGINGFAYDMGASCSSAAFGIHAAYTAIRSCSANVVLLVCPEIKSGQFSYKDSSSNFIFGEATAAIIIERKSNCRKRTAFQIIDISLYTEYSNNIRNNRGAYNRCDPDKLLADDKVFRQNGRKVFREIGILVPKLIRAHLEKFGLMPSDIKRYWLHQANINLNQFIIEKLLGKAFPKHIAPSILDKFGNVSSASVLVCFALFQENIAIGDYCILGTFGAGYAIGSIILKKIKT